MLIILIFKYNIPETTGVPLVPSNAAWKLTKLANEQGGFFTATQAVACGIRSSNHSYYVKKNLWERWQRGVYRLAVVPLPQHPDLHVLALYLKGRDGELQGVFGLETAASIMEIGDFMPPKAHIIAFPSFDRTHIPENVIITRAKIDSDDWHWQDGLPITTALKTIVDLSNAKDVETSTTKDAFFAARSRGLITATQIKTINTNESAAAARLLSEWEGDYGKIRNS